MKRTMSSCVTILALMLLLALPGIAQVTSRVTGVVLDDSGAVLPGANITLTDESTNVVFTTTSTSAGTYLFDAVKPGTYRIRAAVSGFHTFESSGNVLTIGQPLVIRVVMKLGAVSEQVRVNAAAELVQTATSGNIGTLIDTSALQMLPLVGARGRNPLELVELTPGVVDSGGFNQGGPNVAGGGVHVNGARDRAWNYTLDGIDVNETSAGGGNFSPLRANPDMLSEFRVVTSSFTSEYGRNSGAQVEMVSRSGSNQFHGTGFFFYQTPAFMANDPGNIEAGLPRPQWVQKIPGFSFGGPIIKNKTFFFANFQWLQTLRTVHSSQPTYTATARQGILRYVTNGTSCTGASDYPDTAGCRNTAAGAAGASVDGAGNAIVPTVSYNVAANDPQHMGLDPSVQAILNKSPLPNDYTVGDGLNIAAFDWLPAEHERQLDYTIRVDHTFNDAHAIFVRWSAGHQNTIADTANAGSPIFPGFPDIVDTYRTPKNLAVNWRWSLNPRMLNEFTLGMNRFIFNFANPDPNYLKEPAFNFLANPICQNDGICMQVPLQNYLGNLRVLTTYQLVDNFSYTRGAHSLKFGINFRYQRHIDDRGSIGNLNGAAAINFDPSFTPFTNSFNLPGTINQTYDLSYLKGSINDLLGRVGSIQQGIVQQNNNQWAAPGTHLRADFRMPEYDFFAQDTWRVKPNLIVDLGLRWEIKLSPSVTNPDTMLRPDGPLGFGYSSDALKWVTGRLYKNSWKDFGPSIGFAWDPRRDGKTSVRGNYRIAYDRMNTFSLSSTVFQGFPGLTQQVYDTSFAASGGRLSQLTPTVYDSIINSNLTQSPSALRQPPAFSQDSITVVDPNWAPPQTHMWSLGIQHELPGKMVAEVDYLGRKGVHLYGASDANQAEILNNGFLSAFKTLQAGGQSSLMDQLLVNDPNRPSGVSGSNYVRDPNSVYNGDFALGSVAGLASTMAQQNVPLAAGGTTANFFLAYPQFAGGFVTLESHDFSTYHALQSVLRRAFSNGLTFQASYVWSKSIDTRSWDPTFSTVVGGSSPWGTSSTPFDLHNRRLNYAPSDFDRTHAFQSIFVYELPFGKGRRWGQSFNGLLDRMVGGWEIGGFGILESGHPTTIYSPAYTLSSVVRTPANCTGCSPSMFNVHKDPSTGLFTYLTPEQMNQFSTPGPGEYSNVGRNYFRLAPYKNLSMSIGKKTRITESQMLEMRLEVQNITNSVEYDEPASNRYTSSVFGSVDPLNVENAGRGLSSDPRKMQVSLKYTF